MKTKIFKKLILVGLALNFATIVRPSDDEEEKFGKSMRPIKKQKEKNKKLVEAIIDIIRDGSRDYSKIDHCITNGADVNGTHMQKSGSSQHETTPFCIACQRTNEKIVQYLIEKKAHVNQPRWDGSTPLLLATISMCDTVVNVLVNNGATINIANSRGTTLLHAIAYSGHLDLLKYFIALHAPINKTNKNGETPLYIAAQSGHMPVVKYLIEQRAQINKTDNNGKIPICVAAQAGHLDVVRCLEDAGEKIIDLQEMLLATAQDGKAQLVDYLVGKRADVNYIHKDDCTALYLAALNGHKETVKHLIAAGADLNVAGPDQVTPLIAAIKRKYPETVSVLIDAHCLELIAPFHKIVKNIDRIIKQQQKSSSQAQANLDTEKTTLDEVAHYASCPLDTEKISLNETTTVAQQGACSAVNDAEISEIEKLPIECLCIILQNLPPRSVAHFTQSSRACRNAAQYEYTQQLKNTILLKKQNLQTIITQALEYNAKDEWENVNKAAIVALLQEASQRDLWLMAVEAQPICAPTHRDVMSDACYEESCAQRDASRPGCAIS